MEREKPTFDILGRIEQERLARGWSEYALAENSGLTQSTISTWRRRNLQPNIASIEKICSGFGIDTIDCREIHYRFKRCTAHLRHSLYDIRDLYIFRQIFIMKIIAYNVFCRFTKWWIQIQNIVKSSRS